MLFYFRILSQSEGSRPQCPGNSSSLHFIIYMCVQTATFSSHCFIDYVRVTIRSNAPNLRWDAVTCQDTLDGYSHKHIFLLWKVKLQTKRVLIHSSIFFTTSSNSPQRTSLVGGEKTPDYIALYFTSNTVLKFSSPINTFRVSNALCNQPPSYNSQTS